MKIEVSNGEIVDKYTILLIKNFKIQDEEKLRNVKKELAYLTPIVDQLIEKFKIDSLIDLLTSINTELWEIEDDIRELERKKLFNDKFISLARLVYYTNDKRAEVKREINTITQSDFTEEKSYSEY